MYDFEIQEWSEEEIKQLLEDAQIYITFDRDCCCCEDKHKINVLCTYIELLVALLIETHEAKSYKRTIKDKNSGS